MNILLSTTGMLAGIEVLPFVLVPILFIGIIVLAIHFNAKRKKALLAWARANGLTFTPDKDRSIDDRYPQFGCFRNGHSRYGNHFLRGMWRGRSFLAFEYHYTTGSGKNQSHHSFSAVILTNAFPLQALSIRPEGFFDKVTEFFGLDDIDFESAEFSKRFYVKAKEKKWAYDVLHTRAMEYLLDPARRKYTMQFDTSHVLIHRGGATFKPDEFGLAADVVCDLLEMLPEYVVEQQKGLG